MNMGNELVAHLREDQCLLLRAVLLQGDPARDAFAAWRGQVDIDLVDAPSQRLLPLLARRMPDVAPDDPLRGRVRGIYRHAWVTNHRLWRDALPMVDGLRAQGIPTVLLKGAALLDAYGGDWGARPMYDVDLLVPTARAAEAIELFAAAGWVPEQDQTAAWVRWRALPRRHGWGFTREDGKLDLHWHVLGDSVGAHADDDFWAAARTIDFAGTETRVLDPADLLVHLLVHGTVTLNAPVIQWVADSVLVLRAASGDPTFADRLTATARAHGELASVARALDAIGEIIDRTLVAEPLARVERARPTVVEHLRRSGRATEATRQLARHSAGAQGLTRGAAELIGERLDLSLTTRPTAAVSYAAAARWPRVARAWRSQGGSFVRTAVDAPPAVAAGEVLDFTVPETLDRHGAVGWGRTEERGATTRGGEARLVLPLAPDLVGIDLAVTIAVEPNVGPVDLAISANDTRVGRATVPPGGVELELTILADVAGRSAPLELGFRNARAFPPASVRVRIRTVRLDPSPS